MRRSETPVNTRPKEQPINPAHKRPMTAKPLASSPSSGLKQDNVPSKSPKAAENLRPVVNPIAPKKMVALPKSEKRLALPEPKSQRPATIETNTSEPLELKSKKTRNYNKQDTNTSRTKHTKNKHGTQKYCSNKQHATPLFTKATNVYYETISEEKRKTQKRKTEDEAMKVRYIATVVSICSLFFSLLLFFVVITADSEDPTANQTTVTGGLNVSPKVLKHKALVEKYCKEFGIEDYVTTILAIMQVESGGTAVDVMQSSESLGLPSNSLSTEASIKQGCKYFSELLATAEKLGCDSDSVIQSYNYGGGFCLT